MKIKCKYCSRKYFYDRRKGHTRTYCNSCSANRKRFIVKKRMVEYKGGECCRCGYDKCQRALVFHHRNSSEKEITLSRNYGRKWEVLQQELDKCDLLCSNCHMEVHDLVEGNRFQDLEVPEQKKREIRSCQWCGKDFKAWHDRSSFCSRDCDAARRSKIPEREVLEKLVWSIPSIRVAKKFGVSDSAIVKWCRKYGIEKPGPGYWMKKRAKEKSGAPIRKR